MLNDVLGFLKDRLNAHLNLRGKANEAQEDQVVFLESNGVETLKFTQGAITALVINLEQENVLRAPDIYARTLTNGAVQKVQPEIRLNMYVLFVAYHPAYDISLSKLSAVIQYFQGHRLFTHQDSPQLSEKIDQLVVELVTLSFSEQNEVWGALRLPYRPSVLYKVKMVVFSDQAPTEAPEITAKDIQASS